METRTVSQRAELVIKSAIIKPTHLEGRYDWSIVLSFDITLSFSYYSGPSVNHMRLSHRRFSLSSSSRELFWFSSRFPFQLPLCSHCPELPLLRHDVTVYVADFLPQQQRTGDCIGSMIVLLLIIRSQIKLNNDFSNLILFSRVPWFIVY